MIKANKIISEFLEALRQEGLRITNQRLFIVSEFLKEKGHVNADELYQKLRKKNPKVSYTTVYRTLKLMNKYDIIKGVDFGDGSLRYEVETEHHDHLICQKCGNIIEFMSQKIELDQERITREYDFLPYDHRLEIFGICKHCRGHNSEESSPGKRI